MRRVYAGPAATKPTSSFDDDVLEGLGRAPKTLDCKYFYDAAGSALFERICERPEYYLTRTESAIMRANVSEIARRIGPGALVIEFGSGSSTKTRLLLAALERPVGYVPVDISGEQLENSARSIGDDHPGLAVAAVHADFMAGFELPERLCDLARRAVVYFPGSTIGNLVPDLARALLESIAAMLGPQGRLLVGTDLVKATDVLEAAYDDAAGVTAAFNLNLLARINRELGADFELDAFRHVARYDREHARIEMWIESRAAQAVHVAGRILTFAPGERILTEYAHKYTVANFAALAHTAGFSIEHVWIDPEDRFAVQLLRPR